MFMCVSWRAELLLQRLSAQYWCIGTGWSALSGAGSVKGLVGVLCEGCVTLVLPLQSTWCVWGDWVRVQDAKPA